MTCNPLILRQALDYYIHILLISIFSPFEHCIGVQIMILTDASKAYFVAIQSKVRAACAQSKGMAPFAYEDESFFEAYEALTMRRAQRASRRQVANQLGIGREKLKHFDV